jgi:drug/metabolite transporter (DMT)-like permease
MGRDLIDPASFVIVRLFAGAIALLLLTGWRRALSAGSWASAAALAAYAIAFTLAYVRVDAGVGALLHFASVQVTMIGWGTVKGERPTVRGTAGLALAFTGLIVLTAPGVTAPDVVGTLLMLAAGAAWGVYSLHGRLVTAPTAGTAGNFVLALPLVLVALLPVRPERLPSGEGVVLAVLSGAVASGLAYAAWYAAVARLAAWRAAIVQLSVPVITAIAAVPLLDETLSWRLAIASAAVIGGVGMALSRPSGA